MSRLTVNYSIAASVKVAPLRIGNIVVIDGKPARVSTILGNWQDWRYDGTAIVHCKGKLVNVWIGSELRRHVRLTNDGKVMR